MSRTLTFAVAVLVNCTLLTGSPQIPVTAIVRLRGHDQTLRLYGARTGFPVVVASGDGGWIHLAPFVAEQLARKGFFVVGFDTKSYLASFTSARTALRAEEVPADYRVVIDFAREAAGKKPVLIGVSVGAGLSLLAATEPAAKHAIAGVIGLGLPDLNELGWRWRDTLIYVTHHAPDEPTFSAAAIAGKLAPVPLAAIQAMHDEFVPPDDVRRIVAAAKEPKKLWMVKASNHRFSDNLGEFTQRLLDAIRWVQQQTPQ
jgi:fermentation-respiration switch protein FrsA (DUF1100 family)